MTAWPVQTPSIRTIAPIACRLTWRRLRGENQLPKVILGVTFRNGVEVIVMPAQFTAA